MLDVLDQVRLSYQILSPAGKHGRGSIMVWDHFTTSVAGHRAECQAVMRGWFDPFARTQSLITADSARTQGRSAVHEETG